jgi:RHS repeat-associated protein
LTNETIAADPEQNNGSASYSLDPVGNRLSVSTSLTGLTSGVFSYNPDDEVSSETYDANGNATQVGAKSFTYDSENHMTTMSTTGTSVSMIYDGDGNRVGKSVASNGTTVTTYYLIDDLNPTGYAQVVEELNAAGVVQRQYTYGLQRISENQFINGEWTPSFYGYDGGGNVRNLTNSAGAVTDQYEYDAFGNSFTKVGTTPNNYLYRGEQFDPDLGLYYLRARYYNPATGRFMSRDPKEFTPLKSRNKPLDSRRLHKYSYASGDPVNLEDPRGEGAIVNWILAVCLAVCPILSEDEPEHIEVVVEFMEEIAEEVELDILSSLFNSGRRPSTRSARDDELRFFL